MSTIGTLTVKLVGDTSEFASAMDKAKSKMQDVGRSLTNVGKELTTKVTLPLVILAGVTINAASNMQESMNKVQVVFGDSADAVVEFTTTASTKLGMTQQAALEASGTFGNLFSSMGMGQETSAEMSTNLVQLAADLASFNNIDPSVALEKLRAGLVGEAEPLRTLGVNLTAAATEAKAMEMGLAATTDELTPAMLAQARYALILEQTTNAQGDFARTSEGFANSMRTTKAQFGDLAAQIGERLLPFAQQFLGWVQNIISWFANLSPQTQTVILVIAGLAAAIGPVLMILGPLATGIGVLSGVIGAASAAFGALNISMLPIILIIGAIAGAVALLVIAWKNNWGGIQEKTKAVWEWLKGVFTAIWDWLSTAIPAAIETVRTFWETKLLPALNKVWDFIKRYILPIFQTLYDILKIAISLAIEAVAGLWQNVLYPALKKVWEAIEKYLVPIFKALADYVNTKVIPVLEWLWKKVIEPLGNAIKNTLIKALEWVLEQFKKLKDFLAKFTLPDWLTPGSPTPLELGLLGIHEALQMGIRDLRQMDAMMGGMSYPAMSMAAGSTDVGNGANGGYGVGVGGRNMTVYGGVNLYGVQDGEGLLRQLEELKV